MKIKKRKSVNDILKDPDNRKAFLTQLSHAPDKCSWITRTAYGKLFREKICKGKSRNQTAEENSKCLSGGAIWLYSHLHSYINYKFSLYFAYPTYSKINKDTNMSISSIYRYVKEIKDSDYVKVLQIGSTKMKRYIYIFRSCFTNAASMRTYIEVFKSVFGLPVRDA